MNKVLSVVLVVAVLGALGILGYVIATPKVGEEYTEFYILGREGKAADYPEELEIGETGTVVVGIVNHESQEVRYRVEIRSAGMLSQRLGPVLLQHDQEWEQEVGVVLETAGERQKVEFLLFKEGEGEPYRSLHLLIDVR